MTQWKKQREADTDRITLSSKSRVPLSVVGSAIGLAIYGTILYMRLSNQIEAAITVTQAQQWIDDAREMNRIAYPGLVWPRLPAKEESKIEIPKY
jgi:hypothetical protein